MKIKLLNAVLGLLLFSNLIIAQGKIVISSAEDLPKHSYVLENRNALETVQSDKAIGTIAKMLKTDLEADLNKYDIQDNASLKEYYTTLRYISIIDGDYDKAIEYIHKERELADKESERLTRGMETEAMLKAAMAENTFDADKLSARILTDLADRKSVV